MRDRVRVRPRPFARLHDIRRKGAAPLMAVVVLALAGALAVGGVMAAACGPSSGPGPGGAGGARSAAASAAARSGAPSALAVPSSKGGALGSAGQGRADELWSRAKAAPAGEVDDLARLSDYEGAAGILERVQSTSPPAAGDRVTAARALAFADGLSALPWLAQLAAEGADDEAAAALDALAEIAARPRRAVDPEDGAELREGCDRLLALARDGKQPKGRRALAIRPLRMLADRGCMKLEDVPGL